MINVYQPALGQEEADAVKKVLMSNWLGKGPNTAQFEENFARHLATSKERVCSTNCCTEGLFLSMDVFEIGAGDEVILPTCSFVGAGNAVKYSGAEIAFCDVDARTMNVTANDIEKAITPNTKAVLLIHYGGVPCEMDEIMDLANAYGIKVIEDTACGVASRYKGKATGTIGDMGIWSFDAMKILVSGDGGMIHMNDVEKLNWARKYMYFGLESQSGFSNKVDQKWWEFEISSYGHRSIMNDITASMALVQLEKLPAAIARRKEINDRYNEGLKDISWLMIPEGIPSYCESSYYFYTIQLRTEKRDQLAKFLRENEIYTTFRYYPLHWVEFYGHAGQRFEKAEWAANHSLCLPIHHSLTNQEVDYIIERIHEFK